MSSNCCIYYVYAYIKNGIPYYIGKGKGRRAYSKNHTCEVPVDENDIVFVDKNLTEVGALALERRMIRWYGRICNKTGILENKTIGGNGTVGMKYTEEHRNKLKKPKTDKAKENMSKAQRRYTKEERIKINNKISKANSNTIQPIDTCVYCNKTTTISKIARWHNENCKVKTGIDIKQERGNCVYCGKNVAVNVLKRYHNEKCKAKTGKVIKNKLEKCNYCGIELPSNVIGRYHNNNCKEKINVTAIGV